MQQAADKSYTLNYKFKVHDIFNKALIGIF